MAKVSFFGRSSADDLTGAIGARVFRFFDSLQAVRLSHLSHGESPEEDIRGVRPWRLRGHKVHFIGFQRLAGCLYLLR